MMKRGGGTRLLGRNSPGNNESGKDNQGSIVNSKNGALGSSRRKKNPPSRERVSAAIALVRARQASTKPLTGRRPSLTSTYLKKSRELATGSPTETSLFRTSLSKTTLGSSSVANQQRHPGTSTTSSSTGRTSSDKRNPLLPKTPTGQVGDPQSSMTTGGTDLNPTKPNPNAKSVAFSSKVQSSDDDIGQAILNVFSSRVTTPTNTTTTKTNMSKSSSSPSGQSSFSSSNKMMPGGISLASIANQENSPTLREPVGAFVSDEVTPASTTEDDAPDLAKTGAVGSMMSATTMSADSDDCTVDPETLADVSRFIDALQKKEDPPAEGQAVAESTSANPTTTTTTTVRVANDPPGRASPSTHEASSNNTNNINKQTVQPATLAASGTVPATTTSTPEIDICLSDFSEESVQVNAETLEGIGRFVDAIAKPKDVPLDNSTNNSSSNNNNNNRTTQPKQQEHQETSQEQQEQVSAPVPAAVSSDSFDSDVDSVPEETRAGIGAFIDSLQKKNTTSNAITSAGSPRSMAGSRVSSEPSPDILYLSSSEDSLFGGGDFGDGEGDDDDDDETRPETEEEMSAFISTVEEREKLEGSQQQLETAPSEDESAMERRLDAALFGSSSFVSRASSMSPRGFPDETHAGEENVPGDSSDTIKHNDNDKVDVENDEADGESEPEPVVPADMDDDSDLDMAFDLDTDDNIVTKPDSGPTENDIHPSSSPLVSDGDVPVQAEMDAAPSEPAVDDEPTKVGPDIAVTTKDTVEDEHEADETKEIEEKETDELGNQDPPSMTDETPQDDAAVVSADSRSEKDTVTHNADSMNGARNHRGLAIDVLAIGDTPSDVVAADDAEVHVEAQETFLQELDDGGIELSHDAIPTELPPSVLSQRSDTFRRHIMDVDSTNESNMMPETASLLLSLSRKRVATPIGADAIPAWTPAATRVPASESADTLSPTGKDKNENEEVSPSKADGNVSAENKTEIVATERRELSTETIQKHLYNGGNDQQDEQEEEMHTEDVEVSIDHISGEADTVEESADADTDDVDADADVTTEGDTLKDAAQLQLNLAYSEEQAQSESKVEPNADAKGEDRTDDDTEGDEAAAMPRDPSEASSKAETTADPVDDEPSLGVDDRKENADVDERVNEEKVAEKEDEGVVVDTSNETNVNDDSEALAPELDVDVMGCSNQHRTSFEMVASDSMTTPKASMDDTVDRSNEQQPGTSLEEPTPDSVVEENEDESTPEPEKTDAEDQTEGPIEDPAEQPVEDQADVVTKDVTDERTDDEPIPEANADASTGGEPALVAPVDEPTDGETTPEVPVDETIVDAVEEPTIKLADGETVEESTMEDELTDPATTTDIGQATEESQDVEEHSTENKAIVDTAGAAEEVQSVSVSPTKSTIDGIDIAASNSNLNVANATNDNKYEQEVFLTESMEDILRVDSIDDDVGLVGVDSASVASSFFDDGKDRYEIQDDATEKSTPKNKARLPTQARELAILDEEEDGAEPEGTVAVEDVLGLSTIEQTESHDAWMSTNHLDRVVATVTDQMGDNQESTENTDKESETDNAETDANIDPNIDTKTGVPPTTMPISRSEEDTAMAMLDDGMSEAGSTASNGTSLHNILDVNDDTDVNAEVNVNVNVNENPNGNADAEEQRKMDDTKNAVGTVDSTEFNTLVSLDDDDDHLRHDNDNEKDRIDDYGQDNRATLNVDTVNVGTEKQTIDSPCIDTRLLEEMRPPSLAAAASGAETSMSESLQLVGTLSIQTTYDSVADEKKEEASQYQPSPSTSELKENERSLDLPPSTMSDVADQSTEPTLESASEVPVDSVESADGMESGSTTESKDLTGEVKEEWNEALPGEAERQSTHHLLQ